MSRTAVENIRLAVEKASQEVLSARDADKKRGHLGASQIGHRCPRQSWYAFRWFYQGQHTGRLLRLFNRGHEEEARLLRWLRAAGYEVRDHSQRLTYSPTQADAGIDYVYQCRDWDDSYDLHYEDVSADARHIALAKEQGVGPKQWGFVDEQTSFFSGECDGLIRGPNLLEGWGTVEFKTMNDKSFKDIVNKGVMSSKPVYWIQSQIYMRKLKVNWCLFVSTNKNDDDIYYEILHLKPEVADQYIDLARSIIRAQSAPARITEDPSWFECKFCDFREICHYGEAPKKNCRTCQYSVATDLGALHCNLHHGDVPFDFQQVGCEQWLPH